jgi:Mg2+/Co2+ transporter CorB
VIPPLNDEVPLGLLFGLLVFLVVCSAFFSGTETALMSLNRYRLRHQAAAGSRGAQLAERLLKRPDRLIGLIILGNTLVNMLAASLVTIVTLRIGGLLAVLLSGTALTFVILIFGEVTPKTLGALHPERVAFPSAFIYYPLLKAMTPVIWLVTLFSNGVLRLFGVRTEPGTVQHITMEELRTLLAESGALLPRKRHEMMLRVLELGEITVEDIMIPYSDVVGVDLDDDIDAVVAKIRQSGYTRLPVYRERLDNVIGILHLKRLVQQGVPEPLTKEIIEKLVDEPYFVPEGTPLNRQLVQFQRTRQRTAFVVDEYGDIQGLITLEDLLEEIVGEFTSEPDAGEPDVLREAGGGHIVSASANIRVLNRTMRWALPTEGAKTLNGLILEQLETIPKTGTRLEIAGYEVEILKTQGNSVETVRIRAPVGSTAPPARLEA